MAEEINCRAEALKYQVFEMGRLFCEVKKLLRHGIFGKWVFHAAVYEKPEECCTTGQLVGVGRSSFNLPASAQI